MLHGLQADTLNMVEIEKGVAKASLPAGDTTLAEGAFPGLNCACYEVGYDFINGVHTSTHSEYEECTTTAGQKLDVNIAPDGKSYSSDTYDRSLPCLYKRDMGTTGAPQRLHRWPCSRRHTCLGSSHRLRCCVQAAVCLLPACLC